MKKLFYLLLMLTFTSYSQSNNNAFMNFYGFSKSYIIEYLKKHNVEFKIGDKSNCLIEDVEEHEIYYYFNDNNVCIGVTVFYNKNFYHLAEIRESLLVSYPYSKEENGEYWSQEEIATIININSNNSELNTIMVSYRPNIN